MKPSEAVDEPDSTAVSSPLSKEQEDSEMSSCNDEDDEYHPPPGSPSSSSSCSNVSICSGLSRESTHRSLQPVSQQLKSYSKKEKLFKRNKKSMEISVKSCQKREGKRVWDKAHY